MNEFPLGTDYFKVFSVFKTSAKISVKIDEMFKKFIRENIDIIKVSIDFLIISRYIWFKIEIKHAINSEKLLMILNILYLHLNYYMIFLYLTYLYLPKIYLHIFTRKEII